MLRLHRLGARCLAGAAVLLASACGTLVPQTMALRNQWPPDAGLHAHVSGVPLIAQQDYQCGPAALAMAMAHAGKAVSPDEIARRSYLPQRHGSLQAEMLAAPRDYGLISYPLAQRFADLLTEVAAGSPVIVFQDTGLSLFSNWHYAVVVGYDYPEGDLILHSGQQREERVPFTVFEYTWKKSGYWAMVITPPNQVPATAEENLYLKSILALERTGNHGALETAYRAFLGRWPDNLAAAIGLADQAYAQGRLTEAEDDLRTALARHPDSAEALNNLAQVLSDQGRHEEALASIRKAAAMDGPLQNEIAETFRLIQQRAETADKAMAAPRQK